ncbi:hypothetical protein B0H14DRAFT_2607589 [Mycena olivaceomarginata]|nr:hypothetical protein B0H14DRAFT_2607589 [Mycena olivaceomarginata]
MPLFFAAHVDVDAALELMNDDFVNSWGPRFSLHGRVRRARRLARHAEAQMHVAQEALAAAAAATATMPVTGDNDSTTNDNSGGWGSGSSWGDDNGDSGWGSKSGWAGTSWAHLCGRCHWA